MKRTRAACTAEERALLYLHDKALFGDLDPTPKVLLIRLSIECDPRTLTVVASEPELMRAVSCGSSTVRKHMRALREAGLIAYSQAFLNREISYIVLICDVLPLDIQQALAREAVQP